MRIRENNPCTATIGGLADAKVDSQVDSRANDTLWIDVDKPPRNTLSFQGWDTMRYAADEDTVDS